MAWLASERFATSVRAEAFAGSSPRARTSSCSSGARLPEVVAFSSPSIQTSTPAGSVTKKTLASTRTSGTSSGLGVPGGDGDRARLGLVARSGDLDRVLAGQHLEREEIGEPQVGAGAARAHEGDLRPRGLRGDREVADERPLHAVEELDDLRRDPLLRERVVGLELDELAEVLRGLLREADAEVRTAPVLVGLDEDVAPSGRQGARPHRLEPGDDLVEGHDRPALLRPLELGHRPRQGVLRGLHLPLHRLSRLRHRLGRRLGRAQEEPAPRSTDVKSSPHARSFSC